MRSAVSPAQAEAELRRHLCERFRVRHCQLASTGRAGLTLLLRALRGLASADRVEVIVPSYTCYSVPASIVKAGLRPRVVDISEATLDYAPDALASTPFSRVLAVIATNLYGLPNDMPALAAVARHHGVFLIDDAAQAMGAVVGGRPSGTWGDAGLFSFDKGKNIAAIDGGVIVTNSSEVAGAIDREFSMLDRPAWPTSASHVLKALAYFTFLRPSLYGIPARIPQLGLGKTVYTTEFPLRLPDRSLSALARVMVHRLDEFTRLRQANARALLDGLASCPAVSPVSATAGSTPVYLRLPVLFASEREKERALRLLTAAGIGATGSYPASIADVPELKPYLADSSASAAVGRSVARRIATLPTHPFVRRTDIIRTIDIIRQGTASTCAA